MIRTIALAMLLCQPAAAHVPAFTEAENDWLNRQRALDGTKCCDRHDAHIGLNVRWRIFDGRYEVWIEGRWRVVPQGRLMRHDASDPTPWPGMPHLFYSDYPSGPVIWCFAPPPLG